jgi:RimJ/RimL family protein N-acetyltransferase
MQEETKQFRPPGFKNMLFREFKDTDADFCYYIRSAAFTQKFQDEIGPVAVNAAVNSYMPVDYIQISKKMKIFIVEDKGEKIGFVSIKKIDDKTVEIPLIYFDLKYIGKGYGSETMRFVEEWIRENWLGVKKIFLDTIIPKYNGGFYNKIGYKELGESKCIFPGKEVSATRFEKKLKQK